jgi:plastocyanin
MPRTLLSLVLSILLALALAPAVAAAPVPPLDTASVAVGDHDDARDDDDDDRSGHGGGDRDDDDGDSDDDDRSGPGGGDRDDEDDDRDSDDDCSRPREVDDDDDEVVISGPIPSGTTVIDIFDDDCFTPAAAAIDLGGSVTFVNHHSDEHTATGSAFDTGHIEMTGTIAVRDASGVVPSPTPPSSAPPVAGAIEEVAIIDFGFEPTESVVAIGTTVNWTVTQASPHTVTAADGSFDSGILDVGGTFQHTFLDPGSFAYACILHPQMQATVVVDPSLPAVSPLPGTSTGPSPPAGP